MAKYNVGLVGLGEISSYFIHACNLNPKTKVVAVCRRKPNAEDKEKYKNYKYYTEWKQLVEDPEVNCIIIATPPSTHAPITQHALALKKRLYRRSLFLLFLKMLTNASPWRKNTKLT